MRSTVTAVAVAMLVWFAPARADAQVSLQLLGGVTRTSASQPFVAGAIGARVIAIEISGEVGHMPNVLPKGLVEALNQLQADSPVKAIAYVRNTYGLIQVRLISPAGPVRPFLGAAAGVARLRPGFEVTAGGISLGDVFGLTSAEPEQKPLWMASAGLSLDLPKSAIEAGYRFYRIEADYSGFNITGVPVTIHAIYGGLSVRF
jgi:hypothetical protein